MSRRAGRHFLQIPGPSNIPDHVLRAMNRPIIDHRGPEFGKMMNELFVEMKPVFGTDGPVVVFPSSGTGAWEAAIVNTLSAGDEVVMFETGQFATLWKKMAEEGLANVFARHDRHGEAARRAVTAWGLEVLCQEPAEYSSVLTAVLVPVGVDADAVRAAILERFDMSLGTGLGKLAGKVFRIGHLGDFNDLTLMGTLAGVEMGLAVANVPHGRGGVQATMDYLAGNSRAA